MIGNGKVSGAVASLMLGNKLLHIFVGGGYHRVEKNVFFIPVRFCATMNKK